MIVAGRAGAAAERTTGTATVPLGEATMISSPGGGCQLTYADYHPGGPAALPLRLRSDAADGAIVSSVTARVPIPGSALPLMAAILRLSKPGAARSVSTSQ
jgi:hypothetical protein